MNVPYMIVFLAFGTLAVVNILPLFTTYGDDSAARFTKGLGYAAIAYMVSGLAFGG